MRGDLELWDACSGGVSAGSGALQPRYEADLESHPENQTLALFSEKKIHCDLVSCNVIVIVMMLARSSEVLVGRDAMHEHDLKAQGPVVQN